MICSKLGDIIINLKSKAYQVEMPYWLDTFIIFIEFAASWLEYHLLEIVSDYLSLEIISSTCCFGLLKLLLHRNYVMMGLTSDQGVLAFARN